MRVLIFILISAFSFAHEGIEFIGNVAGENEACAIHVEEVYYVDDIVSDENLRAEVFVEIDADHHHSSHSPSEQVFIVSVNPAAPNLLSGVNGRDRLNIFENSGSVELSDLKMFIFSEWSDAHGHPHNARCVNLKRVD